VPAEALSQRAIFGELSLTGELRGCRGTLAVAEGARRAGLTGLVVPRERAREAALVHDLEVAGAATLREVAQVLAGGDLPPLPEAADRPPGATDAGAPDLADVRGHAGPVEALRVAAAGGHNLLLRGAPGTGKTM